jgi:hypothetical protein
MTVIPGPNIASSNLHSRNFASASTACIEGKLGFIEGFAMATMSAGNSLCMVNCAGLCRCVRNRLDHMESLVRGLPQGGERLHRLFVIEHASSPFQRDWERILPAGCMISRRGEWNSFVPQQLGSCSETLLLASAVPRCQEALRLFRWLRNNPLRIPTLAILPDGGRCQVDASLYDFQARSTNARTANQQVSSCPGRLNRQKIPQVDNTHRRSPD